MNNLGVRAIGICGKDANLIEVSKMETGDGYDLGFGEPLKILTQSFLKYLFPTSLSPLSRPLAQTRRAKALTSPPIPPPPK